MSLKQYKYELLKIQERARMKLDENRLPNRTEELKYDISIGTFYNPLSSSDVEVVADFHYLVQFTSRMYAQGRKMKAESKVNWLKEGF